eukprot:6534969-Prymnesium_polylepis.2
MAESKARSAGKQRAARTVCARTARRKAAIRAAQPLAHLPAGSVALCPVDQLVEAVVIALGEDAVHPLTMALVCSAQLDIQMHRPPDVEVEPRARRRKEPYRLDLAVRRLRRVEAVADFDPRVRGGRHQLPWCSRQTRLMHPQRLRLQIVLGRIEEEVGEPADVRCLRALQRPRRLQRLQGSRSKQRWPEDPHSPQVEHVLAAIECKAVIGLKIVHERGRKPAKLTSRRATSGHPVNGARKSHPRDARARTLTKGHTVKHA